MKKSETVNRKFIGTINIDNYEIESDEGFVDIVSIHKTIEYTVYKLTTKSGIILECADTHIMFDENMCEKFCCEFKNGDYITTKYGLDLVISVECLGVSENMYDFELSKKTNHRYYTNGILSHNTLLAKKIAEEIFGSEKSLVRFDMSEYSDKTSVNKLIGSGAGYVMSEQGGVLTEMIKNNPYCVLLFDEIEKADKEVLNLFLQVFDDGSLSDNTGTKVSFKNVIIIMTSNIGAREASSIGGGVGFQINTNENKKSIVEKATKSFFSPEFINRLDKIIQFNELTDENLKSIILIELENLNVRLKEISYSISFDCECVDSLFELISTDKTPGARKVSRIIQTEIEDKICDLYLEKDYDVGYIFKINVDNDKKIKIT